MQIALWVLALVLICALLGATGQVFLKTGADQLQFTFRALLSNWKLILGVSLYLLATVLYIIALRYGDLSVIYPIIATGYIWVALFSAYFLKETFTPFRWLGIFLIFAGVVLIVR